MASISRLLLFVMLLGLGLSSTVYAETIEGLDLEGECAKLVESTILSDGLTGKGDEELEVLSMRKSIFDLLAKDPKKNLVVQNPFMIMNAAQRVSVLLRSGGTDTVRIPGLPQEITVFNLVSDGANKKRIIGQETSIETIANNIDAQANGDRSAASVPLQVGSHGSGKSELIQVLRDAFAQATKSKNSPHALWTFEWKNMKSIPEVVELNPRFEDYDGTIKAVLDDSPVLLLPKEIRDSVIAKGNDAVLKMTGGTQEAMPYLELNPQDEGIRRALLMHYRNKLDRDLTSEEIVTILNHHTNLRRVIWDETSGALPKIDAQGDDVDLAGIFLASNPVMRVTHGPSHLFSWEPSKILKGHGNVVFLDEVLRNPTELLRIFLGVFQDRNVSLNGSPSFPLDCVFITATNASSLQKILQDPDNHALIDRFLAVEMPWTTNPNQIQQILLHNYSGKLKMQKLPGIQTGEEELGEITNANMAEIFPRNADPANTGTDYRYKVILPMGDKEVKFAPHALRLMSYIIAATRMNTDQAKAREVMPTSKLVVSQIFRDPISRIRFEEGKLTDIPAGEVEDLRRIAKLLDEGSEGVASRDAGRWLGAVVAEARRPENHNTISPDLVFKVFMDILGKRIKVPDNKTRLHWMQLAQTVATQLIVPQIDQDVALAMAADQAVIKAAYYDMFDEMSAIYRDPRAATYKSRATNEEKTIDRERLAAVSQIFERAQGRRLDIAQIAMYTTATYNPAKGASEVLHEGLLGAITAYYAKLTSRLVSVADMAKFAQTGEGDQEVRSQYDTVIRNMKKLGYDQASAEAAMRFKGRIEALDAQVQQR
jgi:predicted Ser/Thr protein kinase